MQNRDHYCEQKRRFFNTPPTQPIKAAGVATWLFKSLFVKQQNPILPVLKPDWQQFLASSETSKFIWFGHSSLLMNIRNQIIFIDPVFAKYASPIPLFTKRFQAPPASLRELPKIDLIVYSHDHYDHLDKEVVKHCLSQETEFIVPLGLDTLLQQWGIPAKRIHQLDWWQQLSWHKIHFTAVPSRHNTGRSLWHKNRTLWCGWVIETGTEKIYYSGDSAYGKHFSQIGQFFGGFDLAFIENGQYNTAWLDNHMLPTQTAKAAQDCQARRMMPIHWGAYALSNHRWDEPVNLSMPLIQALGIDTLTPLQGQIFDIHSQTTEWWREISP